MFSCDQKMFDFWGYYWVSISGCVIIHFHGDPSADKFLEDVLASVLIYASKNQALWQNVLWTLFASVQTQIWRRHLKGYTNRNIASTLFPQSPFFWNSRRMQQKGGKLLGTAPSPIRLCLWVNKTQFFWTPVLGFK